MHEFTFTLDQSLEQPLYEQLVEFISEEIRSGRFIKGERLPSKRALCQHLKISRSTVETAYNILTAEGYVEGKERSGYYVRAYERPLKSAQAAASPVPIERAPTYLYRFSTADVDTAEFPYAAWAKLYKQVVQGGSGLLKRGHPQGDAELRCALGDFLHQYRGVECTPGQIVIGAGVDYLLGLIIVLLGNATYALEDPGYAQSYLTIANYGRRIACVPLDQSGMDVDLLEGSGANVAYVTPSHQFPTGITMPAGRRAQLLTWANAAPGRYIIEDDYDSEFRHTTRPIAAMQGMDPASVIYIGTFNRSIAPSVRVAYMVLPEQLLALFRQTWGRQSASVSRFEQQALARFIQDGYYTRHLRRMAGIYRRRRDQVLSAFSGVSELSHSGDEAGLHFLLTHRQLTERELIHRALECGVLVHGLSEYQREFAVRPSTLVIGYGGMIETEIDEAAKLLIENWR